MSLTFSASQASLYSRSTASSSTQFLQGWSRPTTPASSRASPSPTLLATEEPLPLQSNPSSTSPEIPTAALSEVPSASTDANLLQEQEQEYQPRRQHPHRHLIPQHQHNTSPKQESNHGHMLLMLVQGRTHYYKNGTRKADPQWNGDSDLCDDDDDNDNGVLGEEEGRERVLEAAGLETRQDFVNLEGESVNGPCFTSSPLSSSPSSANPSLLLERADPASADLATSAEKTALGSLRRHSAHMDASLSSSNSVPPKLSPRPTKPARISSLGSVRGTKSRASISCSVLPTLAMPSSSHLYHLVPSPTTESDVNHQVGFTE
ncbi:hypothetical protein BC939DRAFT_444203 [Gamsiella multidivaricata]|uniref:uncharacterized protein n=1 Tax=Gamsiella multidivaricata TaxID=101098 RepID=UPI00221F714F|nr:uncharacterized protein BC939DRAFT_444203 [Gamsiella multidivaricata]KAI7827976.1 hypothetical protein BC939DRAFT_444203 [Gamsiella multidivaricata]